MTTQKKNTPLSGEIVGKSGESEEIPSSRELSIRRYLFPALLDEKQDSGWWTQQLPALILAGLLLIGILALYIHGANLGA